MNPISPERAELLGKVLQHRRAADAALGDVRAYSAAVTAAFHRGNQQSRTAYAALADGSRRIAKIEQALAALFGVAAKMAR